MHFAKMVSYLFCNILQHLSFSHEESNVTIFQILLLTIKQNQVLKSILANRKNALMGIFVKLCIFFFSLCLKSVANS